MREAEIVYMCSMYIHYGHMADSSKTDT